MRFATHDACMQGFKQSMPGIYEQNQNRFLESQKKTNIL